MSLGRISRSGGSSGCRSSPTDRKGGKWPEGRKELEKEKQKWRFLQGNRDFVGPPQC